MKIAVYHNLPTGGGKRALGEMTRRLAKNHEVDVFTLSCAAHDFCDVRPYCNRHIIHPFKLLPLAKSPFGRINQAIRMADLRRLRDVQRGVAHQIDEGGYDVVFAHPCFVSQSPQALSFLKTPSVYYCQEPPRQIYEPLARPPASGQNVIRRGLDKMDPGPGAYRNMLKKQDVQNTRSATRVLVNSNYSRENFYRVYGLFARVSYPGVDEALFRPLGLPRENFVLSVGQLSPAKGFDFLIRSLGLIDLPIRPALTLVSNKTAPEERQYLVALAAQSGARVDFKAGISDEELVSLYNRARLTVYAPIMEPLGFVPLESMACGTAVAGVNEAGLRETVLHEQTGLLTARDESEFAAAVVSLLNAPEKLKKFGEAGRQRIVSHWTWDQVSEAVEKNLLAASKR